MIIDDNRSNTKKNALFGIVPNNVVNAPENNACTTYVQLYI